MSPFLGNFLPPDQHKKTFALIFRIIKLQKDNSNLTCLNYHAPIKLGIRETSRVFKGDGILFGKGEVGRKLQLSLL